jgi:probable rRNA maturation factor
MRLGALAPTPAPRPAFDFSLSTRHVIDMQTQVEISDTQGHLHVDRAILASLAQRVLAMEHRQRADISIALVDDATIHALNRVHLGHDWPTDVLSFTLSEPGEAVLAGELVISAERAAATATERGLDPHAELALYLVHGLLHLCGYDDRSDADACRMQARQCEILDRDGLSVPRPTRASD